MSLSDYNQNFLHECSKKTFNLQLSHDNLRVPAFVNASSLSFNPRIPDPSLFDFETDHTGLQDVSKELPSIAECATHLELLQVFQCLRREVELSRKLDEAFGIKPENLLVLRRRFIYEGQRGSWVREKVKIRDDTFDKRREAKWPLFLRLAAARFLSWANAVEERLSRQGETSCSLHVPPIDVMMVWHALLLNPKWFRSFDGGRFKQLSSVHFPWKKIHSAIDSTRPSWTFEMSEADGAWFQETTILHSNLFDFLVKEEKPATIRDYLSRHGTGRYKGQEDGVILEDVPKESADPNVLDRLEQGFLDSCRLAVMTNDTVEKLVNAVRRQTTFVDKMGKQLWIRSPAVRETISRAMTRYERFLNLFKLYPGTMLVPTIDIDLVWHTHQCSPAQYESSTMEIAGRFIDHNDQLGTVTLSPAFEKTKALYRIRFASEYQICSCWDCEALRSAIMAGDGRTHVDIASVARDAYLQVAYHRAVEIARRKGEMLLPIYQRKFTPDDG